MCDWIRDAIDFLFPEPVEQDMDGEPCASIPDSGGADPLKSVSEKQASAPPHAHHAPLPGIPEFYLLPQRIPVKEPDDTPEQADAFVRSGQGFYTMGEAGQALSLQNIRDAMDHLRRSG